ncbi:MAG: deoxyribodipyrimidine photo-lyase [Saprospiraceae bacterium]
MNDFNISSDPFNIVWMRRDLRLDENIALQAAQCQNLPIQIIFIFDTNILEWSEKDDVIWCNIIHQILERIDQQLKKK